MTYKEGESIGNWSGLGYSRENVKEMQVCELSLVLWVGREICLSNAEVLISRKYLGGALGNKNVLTNYVMLAAMD